MARALQGLASGAISGPASALLFHYRGKAGAILTSVSTSSGTAVGPLLGVSHEDHIILSILYGAIYAEILMYRQIIIHIIILDNIED